MLRADNDQRGREQILLLQLRHHFAQRRVGVRQRIEEHGARGTAAVGVAGSCQLLPDAHLLEVHAEDRRDANLLRSRMILAVDLIQDRLHL